MYTIKRMFCSKLTMTAIGTFLCSVGFLMVLATIPLNHASAIKGIAERGHTDARGQAAAHCNTTCSLANNKNGKIEEIERKRDSEPIPPQYPHLTASSGIVIEEKLVACAVDIPDKTPKYRLCSVIQR